MCDEFGPKYKSYLDDLKMYFKLKNKYEKQWQLTKRKNFRSLKNKREGKSKMKLLEKRCIQCKRKGGTLFEFKDGIYTAKCNAVDIPVRPPPITQISMFKLFSNTSPFLKGLIELL